MMGRSHHLPDDRLYECYLADRRGEALDLTAAEHLADCTDCSARYDEVSLWLTAVRAEGEAADDVGMGLGNEVEKFATRVIVKLNQGRVLVRSDGHPCAIHCASDTEAEL